MSYKLGFLNIVLHTPQSQHEVRHELLDEGLLTVPALTSTNCTL